MPTFHHTRDLSTSIFGDSLNLSKIRNTALFCNESVLEPLLLFLAISGDLYGARLGARGVPIHKLRG